MPNCHVHVKQIIGVIKIVSPQNAKTRNVKMLLQDTKEIIYVGRKIINVARIASMTNSAKTSVN